MTNLETDCSIIGSVGTINEFGFCKCHYGFGEKGCYKKCSCLNCSSLSNDCDVFGRCMCTKNYYGELCQYPHVCNSSFGNDFNGVCQCGSGLTGPKCLKCPTCQNCLGKCDYRGYYKCKNGYYGNHCDKRCDYCLSNNPNAMGKCDLNGHCYCKENFYNKTCDAGYLILGLISETTPSKLYYDPFDSTMPPVKLPLMAPWLAAILTYDDYKCNGVLLGRGWGLSLKECIPSGWRSSHFLTGAYSYNRRTIGSSEHYIKNYYPHPSAPLVMFELNKKVFTSLRYPPRLPQSNDNLTESIAMMANWIKIENHDASISQTFAMNITSVNQCKRHNKNHSEYICAVAPINYTRTLLDSVGSPLTEIKNGIHTLVGLYVKKEPECHGMCYCYFYNIKPYVNWIRDIMGHNLSIENINYHDT